MEGVVEKTHASRDLAGAVRFFLNNPLASSKSERGIASFRRSGETLTSLLFAGSSFQVETAIFGMAEGQNDILERTL